MAIFIGGAWPYANGSLHVGHIASLLSGDVLARYFRQKGKKVLYVSGSDCNGTPIMVRARQEETSPKTIAERYHEEFKQNFTDLGFSYDLYTRTDLEDHHQTVQEMFLQLLKNGHLTKRSVEQVYCHHCTQFLPDRYVEGTCPTCRKDARGDQCDHCATLLDPTTLENRRCKICLQQPGFKNTEQYDLTLSHFQNQLRAYVNQAKAQTVWRENAVMLTERYLDEGLQDRAATRDLDYGVPVPLEGSDNKKIYVWIEAVAGYYTASKQWGKLTGKEYKTFWKNDTRSYYVHGKDNIPFHTLIWPAILMGLRKNSSLPTYILSNEYMTIERQKISTSKNWAVWIPDLLQRFHADTIRYYLTVNAPEQRDGDFSWREFVYSHNSELLGAYGNFVQRTVKFIQKSFNGTLPKHSIDQKHRDSVNQLYVTIGQKIEKGEIKSAIEDIFSSIRSANKYFDERKPWAQLKQNPDACAYTLYQCLYMIVNYAQLLHPFLPFSSHAIKESLHLDSFTWKSIEPSGLPIKQFHPLYERIDVDVIDEEIERLNHLATKKEN
ncbi:methionine--tRNA ligase [Alkalihalobacillus sp. LMS6]|uniref:methionine--tRNA ligase n=1 Tax=Alkalihalobacillus sp. LMS6 TaxID=2924034 RepID=UPI0020D0979A|nr:methionine--tRNA ligase [Alkalihalobacillus sp. LMS6]UTR07174.1 methionine--tRNA ligase [Alkalihalobacillus sp. LMS6]